jgi:hypothetical protein
MGDVWFMKTKRRKSVRSTHSDPFNCYPVVTIAQDKFFHASLVRYVEIRPGDGGRFRVFVQVDKRYCPGLMEVALYETRKEAVEYAASLFDAGAEWETHIKGF